MEYCTNIKHCRSCGSQALTEVISFGAQFLSQGFVGSNENNDLSKMKVPLAVVLCDRSKEVSGCGLLQLEQTINRDLLYRQYFYRSSTNATMRRELKDVVEDVLRRANLKEGDYLVDIGSNDGTMLSYCPSYLRRIGVEPARNISWSELDASIQIVNDYFSKNALRQVVGDRAVKVFTACAMFYDLDDPNRFLEEIKAMLAPDGILCIQLSYLASTLRNMNFYDICHEHLEYYSLSTLNNLMERHNLMIVDASTNLVNGGSLRVFITHSESKETQSDNIERLLSEERAMDLFDVGTYKEFYKKIEDLGRCIRAYISNETELGRLVIGLGASTKGNVLLQLFGIDKTMLPYISEINPEKVGLRTLGSDIELISDGQAWELRPSCKLVLPWYLKEEIVGRETEYLADGGKLLFAMPYPHVVMKNGEELI